MRTSVLFALALPLLLLIVSPGLVRAQCDGCVDATQTAGEWEVEVILPDLPLRDASHSLSCVRFVCLHRMSLSRALRVQDYKLHQPDHLSAPGVVPQHQLYQLHGWNANAWVS